MHERLTAKLPYRGRLLALLLAGALLPLAFAPFGFWPLAILCPALFLFLIHRQTRRRAALLGLVFGLGYFGFGTSWVYVSIHDFGFVPVLPSVLLTLLLVVAQAGFLAALGALVASVATVPVGVICLFLFPALWLLQEWIRGWILTGFPWLLLGYAQTDSPMAGWAPVLGVYGITLGVAVSAGALVVLVIGRQRAKILALVSLAFWWLGGIGLQSMHWTRAEGRPVPVALLQGNVQQDVKWRPEQLEPTKQLYRSLSEAQGDAAIVVWPESAIPLFYHQAADYFGQVRHSAAGLGQELIIGVLHVDLVSGNYFNGLMTLSEQPGFYSKRHLVPFTEYLPLQWLLGDFVRFMEFPISDFSKGTADQPLLRAAGVPFASSICYEDAFGEELIAQLPEARFLVNVSNDAWFGRSIAPHQHLQIARMRSLETGRDLLRATNTGVTAIIAANGSVRAQAPQFEATALRGTVQPRTGATPYVRVGNWVALLMMAWMLGAGGLLYYRSRGLKA